ncbi:hypothetical protein [Xanthomonas campestris]|uniref:hypothetical protein n=1 Tax=Xanthomonas campestris TaxID=339 RepID=UPI000E3257AE|nr:hypothetical protein [Xanthomonas campestris]MEA9611106.1 hypothetical protein [Xanthomonas campestris pv. incanae]RFF43439.1 hypothetical protein D0A38_14285 [Xanthomonas campestris pv. incanae]
MYLQNVSDVLVTANQLFISEAVSTSHRCHPHTWINNNASIASTIWSAASNAYAQHPCVITAHKKTPPFPVAFAVVS